MDYSLLKHFMSNFWNHAENISCAIYLVVLWHACHHLSYFYGIGKICIYVYIYKLAINNLHKGIKSLWELKPQNAWYKYLLTDIFAPLHCTYSYNSQACLLLIWQENITVIISVVQFIIAQLWHHTSHKLMSWGLHVW